MSDILPLAQQITCHAWNKDLSMIALSPNTDEVHIYATNKSPDSSAKWERKYVLSEHGGQVSGIDWCPETNLIVTCGHDRNAYVWKLDESKAGDVTKAWKPTLVILRINRAATCVKWSPAGNKFAVGSGAKCIPVCHFEESNDWWISKMIKKHKSSVLSLAWCVNNKFLVSGSSDMKCRVFSAYMAGIDPAEDDGFGEVWPQQHEFGEALAEFDAKSWVHSVAWAPGGFRLAYSGHGSTIHFVQILAGSDAVIQTIALPTLPYTDIAFVSDNAVVASWFDMNVDVFTVEGGTDSDPKWQLKDKLDKKPSAASAASKGPSTGGFASSRALFGDASNKGVAFGQSADTSAITTKHKNFISSLSVIPQSSGAITKISTTGLDGRVIIWDLAPLKLK